MHVDENKFQMIFLPYTRNMVERLLFAIFYAQYSKHTQNKSKYPDISLTFETLLLNPFQFRTNKLLLTKICSRLKMSETTLANQLKSSIAGY